MGVDKDRKADSRKVWETPRILAVDRIPEVLGACITGSTVRGNPANPTCTLGSGARGRCSIGSSIVPDRQ